MRTTTITSAIVAVAVSIAAAGCGGSSPTSEAAASPATTTVSPTTIDRPTETIDELVTITAGRMHARCTGSGDTTVLLMAGWNFGSEAWSVVEPVIAEQTRVCTYDKFGTGTSDPPPTTQTFESQTADLHELLDTIDEPGPFVVVGHSFGGAEAVTFAATYPDEVVGLMLVDASPNTWPDVLCSVPAYAGGCDMARNPTQNLELLDAFPAFEKVAAITTLGHLPMTVMTAAQRSSAGITPEELARLEVEWRDGTERWARLSTASDIVTVQDTGHAIQDDKPEIVVSEILKLVP